MALKDYPEYVKADELRAFTIEKFDKLKNKKSVLLNDIKLITQSITIFNGHHERVSNDFYNEDPSSDNVFQLTGIYTEGWVDFMQYGIDVLHKQLEEWCIEIGKLKEEIEIAERVKENSYWDYRKIEEECMQKDREKEEQEEQKQAISDNLVVSTSEGVQS